MKRYNYIVGAIVIIGAWAAIATVTDSYTPEYFTCNGSTTTFNFTFPIKATSELVVSLETIADGTYETLTLNSDYTVSATNNDYSSGGTITTTSTYASTYQLIASRDTSKTQEVQFLGNAALETTLDRQTMAIQEIEETFSRCIQAPVVDDSPTLVLPAATARASTYPFFNADGDLTVVTGASLNQDITVSAFSETYLDDANAADARTTLGIGTTVESYILDEDDMASDDATKIPSQQSVKAYSDSGTQTMTNKTLTSPVLNTGVSGTAVLDEDDMVSDSNTKVATQQSIKAYVDARGIVQQVNTQTGAVATGTTAMPADDTIPQNTEGDEYMTLAITPKSATNKLKIDVVALLATSSGSPNMTVALFQDSTANALAVSHQSFTSANNVECLKLTHYMTSGTTSSTTFKVRAGCSNAGTTTFNGSSGSRLFGGAAASSITVTEIGV